MLKNLNKNTLKIFGPPGTGKTKTLLDIIERELQDHCTPEDVGFFTFTRKARLEAISRATKLLKVDAKKFEYFKTLHSIAWKIGGFQPQNKMKPKNWYEFAELCRSQKITMDINMRGDLDVDEMGRSISDNPYIRLVDLARQRMQDLKTFHKVSRSLDGGYLTLQFIADTLRKYKDKNQVFDFTDSIEKIVYEDVHVPKLKVVIVDEAQDLTRLQWAMILKFINQAERVYIAGDDDQEIFDWAGAESLFFKNLEGQSKVLNKSYRVPKLIADKSKKLIERIAPELREQKQWEAVHEGGNIHYLDNEKFINYKLEGSYYFLATCGYMLDNVVRTLRQHGMFYKKFKTLSIKEEVIYAINTWKKIQEGGEVYADSIKNLFNFMSTRNKKKPYGALKTGAKQFKNLDIDAKYNYDGLCNLGLVLDKDVPWHEALDTVNAGDRTYIEKVMERNININSEPQITVNTIYGVKGGEADNVILFSNISPSAQAALRENINDLRKVFYTGMTRARKNLFITRNDRGYVFKELYA